MSGQLLILCATAKISVIMIEGNQTSVRSWKEIRLSKQEVLMIPAGLIFMPTGAFVESFSIINLGNIPQP